MCGPGVEMLEMIEAFKENKENKMSFGPWEIVIIFLVVLLLFGGKKLPELAKGLGKGLREFKNASRDIKKEVEDAGESLDEKENK